LRPEDGAPFSGEGAKIELEWTSSHTLKSDEYYQVTLRWTELGAPQSTQVSMQGTSWFVDQSLWLRADQETDRVYYWSVRLARQGTDEGGQEVYAPFSSPSEERSFHWE